MFCAACIQPDVSPEELAKKALAEKADLVIASGGDGTVGAVAGVLVNTGKTLGRVTYSQRKTLNPE